MTRSSTIAVAWLVALSSCSDLSIVEGGGTGSDAEAVKAPLYLSVAALTSASVELRWSSGGGGTQHFAVDRAPSAGAPFVTLAKLAASAVSYRDDTVEPGTSYFYRVTAFDGRARSASSPSLGVTTPAATESTPSTGTDAGSSTLELFVALQSNGFAVITFTGAPLALYRIDASSDLLSWATVAVKQSASNGAVTFTDTERALYNLRFYRASLAQVTPPAPVATLQAKAASSSSLDLSWVDNSDNETSEIVEQAATSAGPWTPVATLAANATSYLASGLSPSTTYFFRVQQKNEVGASAYSRTAVGTTLVQTNQPPTANAGPDKRAPIGQAVAFDGSGSSDADGKIVSYTWAFGDGATALGPMVSHPYATAGTFAVTLTVKDDLGASSSDTAWVTIEPAQAPGALQWAVVPGSSGAAQGSAVVSDANGDVLMAGTFNNNSVFLARYSPLGELKWWRPFAALGEAHAIALDRAGNIFITGKYLGSASFGGSIFNGSLNSWSMFVVKLSPAGDHIWSKGFPPITLLLNNVTNTGQGLAVDSSGDVVLTGAFVEFDLGRGVITGLSYGGNIFIAKLSGADGSLVWAKPINFGSGNAIAVDGSNQIWTTGTCAGSANFGGGPIGTAGAYLVRLDPGGGQLFSKSFGVTGSSSGNAIDVAPNGDVAITGSFVGTANFGAGPETTDPSSQADLFFARFSSTGSHIWSKHVRGSLPTSGIGFAAAMDSQGNALFSGNMLGTVDLGHGPVSGNLFVVKYSPTGACSWSTTVTGELLSNGIAAGASSVLVTGRWQGTVNFGDVSRTSRSQDAYLLSLNP